MARKVSAVLEMEAAQYLGESRKVSAITNAVKAEIDDLGDKADGTSRDMAELAANTDRAGRQVDDLGDKSRGTALDMALLDQRIEATRRHVAMLGFEFAATGDKVAGNNLNKEQSLLGKLEQLRESMQKFRSSQGLTESLMSSLAGAPGSGSSASTAGTGVFSGIAGTPVLGPVVVAGIVTAVAAAAPMLGALVGGIIAGGVVTIGLVGGVMSAIHDPRVQAAWDEFAIDLQQKFFKGDAFVLPIQKSLAILDQGLDDLHLDEAFAKAAPSVQILAQGIRDMLINFMPGFTKLMERSGPIVNELARGLADTGGALGDLVDDVSASRGALDGLQTFFVLLNSTIRGVGNTIKWLEDVYHNMLVGDQVVAHSFARLTGIHGSNPVSNWFDDVAQGFTHLMTHSDGVAEAIGGLGNEFIHAGKPAKDLTTALRELQDAESDLERQALDLWGAHINAAQAMADLQEEVKSGAKGWDLSTEAGRKHQKMVKETIDALEAEREAELKSSDGTTTSINAINAKYDEKIAKVWVLAAALGATRAQIEALEGEHTMKLIVDIEDISKLNKVDRAIGLAFGGARAAGGPVQSGYSYLVGENGPEILTMGAGGAGGITPSVGQWQSMAPQPVINNYITLLDPMTGQRTRGQLITEATSRGVSAATAAAAYP